MHLNYTDIRLPLTELRTTTAKKTQNEGIFLYQSLRLFGQNKKRILSEISEQSADSSQEHFLFLHRNNNFLVNDKV